MSLIATQKAPFTAATAPRAAPWPAGRAARPFPSRTRDGRTAAKNLAGAGTCRAHQGLVVVGYGRQCMVTVLRWFGGCRHRFLPLTVSGRIPTPDGEWEKKWEKPMTTATKPCQVEKCSLPSGRSRLTRPWPPPPSRLPAPPSPGRPQGEPGVRRAWVMWR